MLVAIWARLLGGIVADRWVSPVCDLPPVVWKKREGMTALTTAVEKAC